MTDVVAVMRAQGVVPVVEIGDGDGALALCDALAAAGMSVIEVTLRTAAALEAIRTIIAERPDVIVGAGTVLSARDAEQAAEAGAAFLVSPGCTARIGAAARSTGLPLVPGVSTPSEILAALDDGHRALKFFPAEASGGVRALAAFGAPFARLDVSFMPTGGIRPSNLADYLRLPHVFAVGGTWIASSQAIAQRDGAAIEANAREAAAAVAAARTEGAS